jgi:hypothetical protein
MSENHPLSKKKKNAFYVAKSNRIFKKNHKNIKEIYKVYRFNILKTPVIHSRSKFFIKMATSIHLLLILDDNG